MTLRSFWCCHCWGYCYCAWNNIVPVVFLWHSILCLNYLGDGLFSSGQLPTDEVFGWFGLHHCDCFENLHWEWDTWDLEVPLQNLKKSISWFSTFQGIFAKMSPKGRIAMQMNRLIPRPPSWILKSILQFQMFLGSQIWQNQLISKTRMAVLALLFLP